MKQFKSAYEQLDGIVYVPRMLEKIRMHAKNELPREYIPFLGNGFDKTCTAFLGIQYKELEQFILEGKSDDEAMAWIRENGRDLTDLEKMIFNEFMTKRGWKDMPPYSNNFAEYKEKFGLGHRDDIQTYFEFFEVDEGRKP
ncbi:MAG: DUF5069 domain-containing protein [Opitutales bacterium]